MTTSINRQFFALMLLFSCVAYAERPSCQTPNSAPTESSCPMSNPEQPEPISMMDMGMKAPNIMAPEQMVSADEIDIIMANPNESFVYISADALNALRNIPVDAPMPQLVQMTKAYIDNKTTAPYDAVVEMVDWAIGYYSNFPASEPTKSPTNPNPASNCVVLENYRESLRNGEANISVIPADHRAETDPMDPMDPMDSETMPVRSRRKGKIVCSLIVRDCLRASTGIFSEVATKNLIVQGNAQIGNDLTVKGDTHLQNLSVAGSACIQENLQVGGDQTVCGTLSAQNLNLSNSSVNVGGTSLPLVFGCESNLKQIRGTITFGTTDSTAEISSTRGSCFTVAPIDGTLVLDLGALGLVAGLGVGLQFRVSFNPAFSEAPTVTDAIEASTSLLANILGLELDLSGIAGLAPLAGVVNNIGAYITDVSADHFDVNILLTGLNLQAAVPILPEITLSLLNGLAFHFDAIGPTTVTTGSLPAGCPVVCS